MKKSLLTLLLTLFFFAGCSKPPLPSAVLNHDRSIQLQPIAFKELPGWSSIDFNATLKSFAKSCEKLSESSLFYPVCQKLASAPSAQSFFTTHFQPYLWSDENATQKGLITGYYEPQLEGRLERDENYTVPLLAPPKDMIKIYLAQVIPELRGKVVRGRYENGKILPYYTRKEITSWANPDNVICWVKDKVDLFFLQVQGSGRVKLCDSNETLFVGYGDKNGHPYRSIGQYMIDNAIMPYSQMSLQGIKAWAQEHPEKIDTVLNHNPSYLFFNKNSTPAKGAQGVVLTPRHSVAVDTEYIPFGTPVFISTTHPITAEPFVSLAIAQDKGAAIKGERRIDFFWGFGEDAANLAGHTKSRGDMVLLLPKEFEVQGKK